MSPAIRTGFLLAAVGISAATFAKAPDSAAIDRIQTDDLKQASVIMAANLYDTAMRDDMLPRKPMTGG